MVIREISCFALEKVIISKSIVKHEVSETRQKLILAHRKVL